VSIEHLKQCDLITCPEGIQRDIEEIKGNARIISRKQDTGILLQTSI
jgi:hypothetical protein